MTMTRKKLFFMFGALMILFYYTNIFGYVDTNHKPKYAIATANVNFRTQPNTNKSSIIKVVPKNTPYKIVGSVQDFYIVQLQSNEVGFISKKYTKIQGSSLSKAKVYESVAKYYAYVKGSNTNLRGGPSTSFRSQAKLAKNTKVQVIGKIDNFLMVVTENNTVGMIRNDLVTKTVPSTNTNTNNNNTSNNNTNTGTTDANTVLALINQYRKNNGLPALNTLNILTTTAQTKARDMVEKKYFSHNSPTYGSPFKMMQANGISYRTAGENIAGNSSLQNAVSAWMNSETHKKNILSNAYNYVGIGVQKSSVYGYIIVAMFIGK